MYIFGLPVYTAGYRCHINHCTTTSLSIMF